MSDFKPFDLVMEKLIYPFGYNIKNVYFYSLYLKKEEEESFIPEPSFRSLCIFPVSPDCGSITEVNTAVGNYSGHTMCL